MRQKTEIVLRTLGAITLCVLTIIALHGAAIAKKQPKTYPEQGKVTGSSTAEHLSSFPGPHAVHTRVYRVETDTRTYEFECGSQDGCGGTNKLQIGDTVHFRMANGSAFIPAPEDGNSTREEKLRIVKEDLKVGTASQ